MTEASKIYRVRGIAIGARLLWIAETAHFLHMPSDYEPRCDVFHANTFSVHGENQKCYVYVKAADEMAAVERAIKLFELSSSEVGHDRA